MVETVGRLVVWAMAPESDGAARYAAFEELVRRFQDPAVAWAFGRLGDKGLAEDAAQEAFVRAWLNLGQLRSPEAFPGWFRQILMRECGRLQASRGPVTEMIDGLSVPAPEDVGLATQVEQIELRQHLLAAVAGLPEHERVAVLLHYWAGRSQREVAAFLDVTANTVKQRLHSARRRLKGRLTEEMAEELWGYRPSRDEVFTKVIRLRLRTFGGDYAGLAALVQLAEANAPPEHLDVEDDQAEWLANRRRFDEAGLIPNAYTVVDRDSDETLAYGCIERLDLPASGDYPPTGRPGESTYRVHFVTVEGAADSGAVHAMHERLEADARALGATRLWSRDTSEHMDVLDGLAAVGFEELYRVHEWHVVVADWERHEQVPAGDVTVATLADEMSRQNDYVHELQAFWNTRGGRTAPDEAFTRWEVESRLASPHVVPESYFIARRDGQIVGVLIVRRPHTSTPSKADMHFRVLAESEGQNVESRLLAAAVEYGREKSIRLFTAYFRDAYNDVGYLQGAGLRRSVDLIVMQKALAGSSAVDGDAAGPAG